MRGVGATRFSRIEEAAILGWDYIKPAGKKNVACTAECKKCVTVGRIERTFAQRGVSSDALVFVAGPRGLRLGMSTAKVSSELRIVVMPSPQLPFAAALRAPDYFPERRSQVGWNVVALFVGWITPGLNICFECLDCVSYC